MAPREWRTHDGHQESRVPTSKSYTKEYKLEVVCFYNLIL